MVSIFSMFNSSNQSQVVHRRFPLLKTLLPELSAIFIPGRILTEHVRSDSLANTKPDVNAAWFSTSTL